MIRWIALALFFLVGALVEPLTWGFSLHRHHLPPHHTYLGDFPLKLSDQTWTLKAQGGQSYVFISEDGSYVLKLFKDQPRPWLQLPSYRAKKNKKLLRTLTGYQLIYDRCPDLSGIVCLNTPSSIPATLIDRLGIHHTVDLRSYLFVLQRKAEPVRPPTTPAEKESLLSATTHLLQTLSSHQLQDHDPRLHLNLGLLEGRLILIDPGKIALSDHPSTELPDKFIEFIR